MLHIRAVSEKDWPAFCRMYLDYMRDLHCDEGDITEEFVKERYWDVPELIKYQVYDQEGIVGFAVIQHTDDPEALYIVEFYILLEKRRNGYGKEAVAYLLDLAKEEKKPIFFCVKKDNKKGRAFWKTVMGAHDEWYRSMFPKRQQRAIEDHFGDDCETFVFRLARVSMKNMQRSEIIKQTILRKCEEREALGYDTLQSSDITAILEELREHDIVLTMQEMLHFGFADQEEE